jgi:alpha-D-ribose 1-methylphosphonate 5-triphosphate synthase subunit PhnH
MNSLDLSKVVAGFSDVARDSQAVFRQALHALSHPGLIAPLALDYSIPAQANPGSAVLLLALLDADSRLWLSASLSQSDAANWIVFHSGCSIVQHCSDADFAWVAQISELPPLENFNPGTDEYPDQSTTIVLDVAGLSTQADTRPALTLRGPGIEHHHTLNIASIAAEQLAGLIAQWQVNHAQFPKGVDMFLADAHSLVGLPRTTQVQMTQYEQDHRA